MASGDIFHADVHIEAGGADPIDATSGLFTGQGTPVYVPQGAGNYRVKRVTVSGDVSGRIVVGYTDQDNQRVRAGFIPANGGMDAEACPTFSTAQPIFFWHATAGSFDVAVEGFYL